MPFQEQETKIVVIGGGSGPISIEDELLCRTPNVVSITGTHDYGGNTKLIRSILGFSAPGDLTHRIAVHIRNQSIRALFTHRWNINGDQENYLNGRRPSNELLAAAEYQTGNISRGVRLLEEMINPKYYLGRVIPITDDHIHIRARLEDGSHLDLEDQIDQRKVNKPAIIDIDFIDINRELTSPTPNSEAIDHIYNADGVMCAASSLWTSNMPILKVPGIAQAIRETKAPFILCCNAVTNYGETDGYTTSVFAKKISSQIGKKIDYALLNYPRHGMPLSYETDRSYPVEIDKEATKEFVDKIYTGPFTEVYTIEGRQVIRHNGELVSRVIMAILKERYRVLYNGNIELPFLG